MERITEKQLDSLCDYINKLTGSPTDYRNAETGKINVGHYTISHAYGGVCLHRICNDGGGCSTPLSHGHISKRELYNEMQAFIKALDAVRYGDITIQKAA